MTMLDREQTPHTGSGQQLRGTLGVGGLVLTALAFNTPLATLGGFVPLNIGLGLGAATPIVYLVVMALMLAFAVGLVHMGKHMEKPGAFYSYVTAGLGRIPGLGAGFLALLAYFGLAVGCGVLGGHLWSELFESEFGFPHLHWAVYALSLTTLVTALTLFNIDFSARVLVVVLALEVVSVFVWEACVFAKGGADGIGLDPTTQLHTGSYGYALLWGVGCMMGFESIQVFRAETTNPTRDIPRATYLTVIALAGFYALASWVYLVAYGTDHAMATAADPTSGFLDSVGAYASASFAKVVHILLVTTGLAAVIALQNIMARYLFALGRDGVLPSWLGHVNTRFDAPTRAAAVVGSAVFLAVGSLALSNPDVVKTYAAVTGLANLTLISLLMLTSAAVLVYFRRRVDLSEGAFRTVVAPAIALLGLLVVLYLSFQNREVLVGDKTLADLGIALIVALFAGACAYAVWLRANRPEVWARVGAQDDA